MSGALGQVPVPQRKMAHQLAGINAELDEIRLVTGFADLWKVSGAQPRAVRAIYKFNDLFESLVFGQSMLERLSNDGRLHSRLFIGGSGDKVRYFESWMPALGEYHRISLTRYSQGLIFWLSGETAKRPDLEELAKEYSNQRVPSAAQITLATAVFESFLLGLSEWKSWEYVGRITRTLPDQSLLRRWRDELKARFRKIQMFHADLERCFLREVGAHYELDSVKHRRFVEQTLARLRDCISLLAAQAVEEAGGTVIARFASYLLLKSKPPAVVTDKINQRLHEAFSARTP